MTASSTGVIEDYLPPLGALAPDQRKDPIILRCFAPLRALEMKTTCHHRELLLAARPRQHAHFDIVKPQRPHLLGRGVVLLVAFKNPIVPLADVCTDEGGLGR